MDILEMRAGYRPVPFFALYFILSWIPMWLAVLSERAQWPIPAGLLVALGGIGAPLAAIILVHASRDRHLISDFWRRVIDVRRIGTRWWLIIFLTVPALTLVAALIATAFGDSLRQLRFEDAFLASPLIFLVGVLLFGPIPEELGLRGYGIDSLRSRYTGLAATLILGTLWMVWHLPLVFIPGSFQNQLLASTPLLTAYFAQILASAFIIHWIFYNNARSILSAILYHFSGNLTGMAATIDDVTRIVQAVLLVILAAALISLDRKTFLADPEEFYNDQWGG